MKQEQQMSESFSVGAILALVGGFLDAYSYMARGGVFANAQTGNIVLVGICFAQGKVWDSFRYFLPIISFSVGITCAEWIRKNLHQNKLLHWRQIVIALELIVLFSIAYLPERSNLLANSLLSLVCSLQVQSFRKVNGKSFATTMCTGNLRSATEFLCVYFKLKDPLALQSSLQYYAIILAFIFGAFLGVKLVELFSLSAIFFACGCLALVFAMLFAKNTTIN